MMRLIQRLLAVSVMLGSLPVLAEGIDVNVGAGGAQDLLNLTQLPSQLTEQKSPLKVDTFCKDSAGNQIKPGEAGYQDCLAKFKQQQQQPKQGGTTEKANANGQNAAGFSVQMN